MEAKKKLPSIGFKPNVDKIFSKSDLKIKKRKRTQGWHDTSRKYLGRYDYQGNLLQRLSGVAEYSINQPNIKKQSLLKAASPNSNLHAYAGYRWFADRSEFNIPAKLVTPMPMKAHSAVYLFDNEGVYQDVFHYRAGIMKYLEILFNDSSLTESDYEENRLRLIEKANTEMFSMFGRKWIVFRGKDDDKSTD